MMRSGVFEFVALTTIINVKLHLSKTTSKSNMISLVGLGTIISRL